MDWNQPLKINKNYAKEENLNTKFLIYDAYEKGTKFKVVLKMISYKAHAKDMPHKRLRRILKLMGSRLMFMYFI